MSCERGNCAKSGRQKYQNRRAFRNDLHNCSRTIKALNSLEINGCCKRCMEVIEWKIKFNKYKQLNQPKKCVKCLQKSVKNSYYTTCQKCIESQNICGKCGDALSNDSQSQAANTSCGKASKEISSKSKSSKSSRHAKKAEIDDEEDYDEDEEDNEDNYDDCEYRNEKFNNTDEHKEGQTKLKGSIALKIARVADEKIPSKHNVKFKDQCEDCEEESGKKSEEEHESDDKSKDERNAKETAEIDTEQSSDAEDGDSDDESYNTDYEDETDEDDSKQTRH